MCNLREYWSVMILCRLSIKVFHKTMANNLVWQSNRGYCKVIINNFKIKKLLKDLLKSDDVSTLAKRHYQVKIFE